MRAVVTDATGRVGRAVIDLLAQMSCEIVGLVDRAEDKAETVDGATLRVFPNRPGVLAKLLQQTDYVFALSLGRRAPDVATAEKRLKALIAAAAKAEVGRFVLLGSEEVYSAAARARGTVRETGPFIRPDRAAPRGLAAGRAEGALYGAPGPMGRVVLRAPGIYGPDSPGLVEAIREILETGRATDTPARYHGIHLEDLARALLAAATVPAAAGHAINVADSFSLGPEVFEAEIRRLGRLLSDQAEDEDKLRPDYPLLPPVLSTDKAARLLDFRPRRQVWASLAEIAQAEARRLRDGGSALPAVAPAAAPILAIEAGQTPLQGKSVVLTGGTSGIGRAAAVLFARLGADLAIVARNPRKADALVTDIAEIAPSARVRIHTADLSSQSDIRRVAQELAAERSKVDILVNNAGGMFGQRRLSVDGIEMTFALNHLGPFLLTNLLADLLVAAGAARVITLSSEGHRSATLDFDNLQAYAFDTFSTYSVSKLANVMFTYSLARRAEGSGVSAFVLHPGHAATEFGTKNAGMTDERWEQFSQRAITPEMAARYVVNLAIAPEFRGKSRLYLNKADMAQSSPASYDAAAAERLWEVSEQLTGLAGGAETA